MSHPLPPLSLTDTQSPTPSPQNASAIVVVDAAVQNYQSFLASSLMNLQVYRLNAQEDGIAQLQALLSRYQHLSSIHLICQGAPGQMQLGTTRVCEANLWAYADDFRKWRGWLTDNAKISIYGCDLAANRVGKAFVSWLGLLTGACVRAQSVLLT